MTLNLSEIWMLSDSQLGTILGLEDQKLTEDQNFDRVVAATILYNHGKLDSISSKLVELPLFIEIMSQKLDYNEKISQLTFGTQLINDEKVVVSVDNTKVRAIIFDIEINRRFNEANLAKMLYQFYTPLNVSLYVTSSKKLNIYKNGKSIIESEIHVPQDPDRDDMTFNGQYVFVHDQEKSISVYSNNQKIKEINTKAGIIKMAANDNFLVVVTDNYIIIYDVATLHLAKLLAKRGRRYALSIDANYIVLYDFVELKVFDINTLELVWTINPESYNEIIKSFNLPDDYLRKISSSYSAMCINDGIIYFGHNHGGVSTWDIRTRQFINIVKYQEAAIRMIKYYDNKLFLGSITKDSKMIIVDLTNNLIIQSIPYRVRNLIIRNNFMYISAYSSTSNEYYINIYDLGVTPYVLVQQLILPSFVFNFAITK